MIRDKTKVKILEFHELLLSCFLAFPESKKIIKETAVFYNMH